MHNVLDSRFQDKYLLYTYVDINLKIGDIVIDVATGDVGLLVSRYSLFEDLLDSSAVHLINGRGIYIGPVLTQLLMDLLADISHTPKTGCLT